MFPRASVKHVLGQTRQASEGLHRRCGAYAANTYAVYRMHRP
jgi:hypothetical protein